jgi:hypothetical protein
MSVAAVVAALAPFAGCGEIDDRPAEWSFISPAIFQPDCATSSCHSPATSVSGLDFSTPDNGYSSLTRLQIAVVARPDAGSVTGAGTCEIRGSTTVCTENIRPLVTPYDPDGSRVVNMLRARSAPRMPPDRPLPEADIRLVERWILNGACRRGSSCGRDAGPDSSPASQDAGVPSVDATGVDQRSGS